MLCAPKRRTLGAMQAPTYSDRHIVLEHTVDSGMRVLCTTCEHSEFVHGDLGARRCLYTVCECTGFVHAG